MISRVHNIRRAYELLKIFYVKYSNYNYLPVKPYINDILLMLVTTITYTTLQNNNLCNMIVCMKTYSPPPLCCFIQS